MDLSGCVSDDFSEGGSIEIDLVEVAKSTSKETSTPALWLYLLSRLVQLTVDDRDEVRHSECQGYVALRVAKLRQVHCVHCSEFLTHAVTRLLREALMFASRRYF